MSGKDLKIVRELFNTAKENFEGDGHGVIPCLGWCKYKLIERQELQKEVQEYLEYYDYERPHLGLDMRTPLPPICRI